VDASYTPLDFIPNLRFNDDSDGGAGERSDPVSLSAMEKTACICCIEH
jgi:hypothetical protein